MGGHYQSLFFLSRFQAQLDRLFKEALELDAGEVPIAAWQPAVDIVETASSILILIELPGCSAADLVLEVKGPLLVLSGSRAIAHAESAVKFLCVERSPGRFSREIQLFWPVNSHKGKALLADGLLTVEFPKIQDKRQAARTLRVVEAAAAEPSTAELSSHAAREGRTARSTRALRSARAPRAPREPRPPLELRPPRAPQAPDKGGRP